MPHWLSMSNFWLIGLYAVIVAATLRATWRRPTAASAGSMIWLTGVAVPLGLVSITLVRWAISRHWDYAPAVFAIVTGTGAWVGYFVSRDAAPIRWGARSDILGRAAIVVMAAGTALLGVIETQQRYGSVNVARQWYVIAIVLLLVSVVLKPAWVRALYRTPQPTQR
jgi:hypothetical protein